MRTKSSAAGMLDRRIPKSAQFFLKWILAQPAVTCVIPGTRNPRHAADNLGAGSGPLPDNAMRRRMAEHFHSL